MDVGEVSVPGYRFAAHTARMYRFTNPAGRSGWGFHIVTHEAFEEPAEDDETWGQFPYPVQLTTEQEPIPLPEADDLTGVDFSLKEPSRPGGGDYFLFTPIDSHPVSDVRIRFLERQGARYRIELTGKWHEQLTEPTEFRYSGWVQVEHGPGTADAGLH